MSTAQCPSQAVLLDFVDENVTKEQSSRIALHLQTCRQCSTQVAALRSLITDVAAPLDEDAPLDVDAHVASVLQRMDETPPKAERTLPRLWVGVGVALAAAAAFTVLLRDPQRLVPSIAIATGPAVAPQATAIGAVALGPTLPSGAGEWTARGSAAEASLARDVGVQLYVDAPPLSALESGQTITRRAALTAGLRNVSSATAYLLLFCLDARGEVHWIAPLFTVEGSDPQSTPIPPGPKERLLNNAVVFDDLPAGPLTLVTLLSSEPERVSRIEGLAPSERSVERLRGHFPKAKVASLSLTVAR